MTTATDANVQALLAQGLVVLEGKGEQKKRAGGLAAPHAAARRSPPPSLTAGGFESPGRLCTRRSPPASTRQPLATWPLNVLASEAEHFPVARGPTTLALRPGLPAGAAGAPGPTPAVSTETGLQGGGGRQCRSRPTPGFPIITGGGSGCCRLVPACIKCQHLQGGLLRSGKLKQPPAHPSALPALVMDTFLSISGCEPGPPGRLPPVAPVARCALT